jgi:octaheme c-type cytochrome (tetrathionate reductase family)
MAIIKQIWAPVLAFAVLAVVLGIFGSSKSDRAQAGIVNFDQPNRVHLDHAAFFNQPFKSGQDVTRACLQCHEDSASEMMKTAHWEWLGDEVEIPGHEKPMRIGKSNLINNFCIGINGNQASCTRCHAGYGWKDDTFDFDDQSRVDCLVCHDWTGNYTKTAAGYPRDEVDLLASARSVGYPKRENCGYCHNYGGGGLGVKHGDLDNSLDNPPRWLDVHMGGENMLCIDCHGGDNHNIRGRSISVSVDHANSIGCADCHTGPPHEDERLNMHTEAVACQTCHIPNYAYIAPTKMNWDWSKAGDDSRQDEIHSYLKIKGEFIYDHHITPEYYWFNGTAGRYIVGDKMDPTEEVKINTPLGDIDDPQAKIWPFKVHRGKQPFDAVNNYLIPPVTSGEGGFWREFDWEQAVRLGAKIANLEYSGEYGFTETAMYWPLSHMVSPSKNALQCADCHGAAGRMDWEALGYDGDPLAAGRR